MTTSLWCLVVVAFLPILVSFTGAYFKTRQFGKLDNKDPRTQAARLEGAGARIWAAQQNAWEALGMFGAVVLVAHVAGADPGKAATASLVFVATRVLHPIFYAANLDVLRSLVFLVGLGCCLRLVQLAASA